MSAYGIADLIAVSAIVVGFGVTAIMRVQRELYVYEVLKIRTLWLAWADYLILGSIMLAVFVLTALVATPSPPRVLVAIAAASCVAAVGSFKQVTSHPFSGIIELNSAQDEQGHASRVSLSSGRLCPTKA